jgi:Fungal chitosanase of glycosyl hydrolase group 75/Carbohydrate binding module (family 6)
MVNRRWFVRGAALMSGGLVAGLLLPVVSAHAAATRYEAENATISQGTVASNHTGFSGTGFVDYTNVTGSYVQFTVTAANAGTATVSVRYANGTTVDRPMDIAVNGTTVAAGASFGPTANWDTWATKTFTVAVNAGSNTIRATATTANGGPNVDFLDFELAAPATDYQAEDATISQGTVANNHLNYTGTGFVDYTNVTGSYVEWNVNVATAGSTSLTIRYANGTTTNRPMNISVNGATVASNLAFNGTGNWDTWATQAISAALNAGTNTVRATATTSNGGPNVDKLTVGGAGSPSPTPTASGAPTAADLLAKVTTCSQISNGKYKTDSDVSTATVAVCQKTGAVFWKADMDIDCDGVRTTQCNENTDCCFQNDTACHTSTGSPLNSAQLPYVVVPKYQIGCGTVIAVIYNNKLEYAVMGDTGPSNIIGEASYSTASALGIDPDPSTGGVDSGVTYIVFQGSQRVSPIESHTAAVTLGQTLARNFINNN